MKTKDKQFLYALCVLFAVFGLLCLIVGQYTMAAIMLFSIALCLEKENYIFSLFSFILIMVTLTF